MEKRGWELSRLVPSVTMFCFLSIYLDLNESNELRIDVAAYFSFFFLNFMIYLWRIVKKLMGTQIYVEEIILKHLILEWL